MCKINGHSLFTYLFKPAWEAPKTFNSKKKEQQADNAIKAAQQQVKADIEQNHSKGDEISETASTAKVNNKIKKNQTLSSLRVPLETSNVGASVGGNTGLGLNLGG